MNVEELIEELRKLPRKARVRFQNLKYQEFYEAGDVYLVAECGGAVPRGTVVVDVDLVTDEDDDG